ncbi:MAG: DUF1508 domain-containing protein [Dehalococcoidales bacterium]|nr:DUF1508 domain-containing protein [Dehalococcoidales bacterium]
MTARFEIYKDKIGAFRWRLTHRNGHIIAASGEGYTTKVNAIGGINSVKENVPEAAVEDRSI